MNIAASVALAAAMPLFEEISRLLATDHEFATWWYYLDHPEFLTVSDHQLARQLDKTIEEAAAFRRPAVATWSG